MTANRRAEGDGVARDALLDAAYRASPDDAPPPALDDAIRAAARRAVGSQPRPAGASFARWQWPLSVAAVLVLSASLVVVMREEGGELARVPQAAAPAPAAPAASAIGTPRVELVPQDAPSRNIGLKPPPAAGAPAANPYALDAGASGVGMREAGDAQRARREERPAAAAEAVGATEARARAHPGAAPAPAAAAPASGESRANLVGGVVAPAPQPLAAARREEVAVDRLERESAGALGRRDAPASPVPRAAAPAPVAKTVGADGELVAELSRLSPVQWLERLEAWRQQGRLADARAGLLEFQRRYPEHPVPTTLRSLLP